ncbi:MAG: diguanylate cyclase, partial [Acidimicrobiia bacterium]|nr:diguanylate cyclase [Acidimicrobiia bacterium]
MTPAPSSPTGRVWLLTAGLAAFALVLFFAAVVPMRPLEVRTELSWLVLVPLFAAAEVFVVHLKIRRDAHSFSLSEIPLVLGMAFTDPVLFVAARMLGAAVGLVLHRRQTGIKLAFNLSAFLLEACLAVVLYRLVLGSGSPDEPRGWIAALVALMATNLVSAVAITGVIALASGRFDRALFGQALAAGAIAMAGNTTLALVSVIALGEHPWSVVLLLVVAAILFTSYRAYTGLSQGYARLEILYRFTRAVGRSVDAGAVTEAMLTEARDLLRAEVAELRLSGDPSGPVVRVLPDGEGGVAQLPLPANRPTSRAWWAPALDGAAVLLPRGARDEDVRQALAVEGFKDAMAVPVRREDEVLGVAVVANRLDEVSTFDKEDLKLFETLTNHASVALENGRLVDALRQEAAERQHQAYHDALTSLPNRRLFSIRVDLALAKAAGTRLGVAVLFMDLNRFKEINDTLGHDTGDALLREVGGRFEAIVPPGGTIARLGGDEFAVLVPGLADEDEARTVAEDILRAVAVPFSFADITLDVDACIGVALSPRHGEDASVLMQRADVAMYTAKARHTDVEVYEPAQDQHSARRLAMVAELRVALEEERLEIRYQPKVELATGRVIGAEALLRWRHPDHGWVPPEEFVAVAEHTGLIRPLTSYVLERAVGRAAGWRAAGLELGVAVNLSVRSLLDPNLSADVSAVLDRHGLPAEDLTLEITESSIMGDVARSLGVLDHLHAMGVRLAID